MGEALLSLEDSVGLQNVLVGYGKQMEQIAQIINSAGGVNEANIGRVEEEIRKATAALMTALNDGQEDLKDRI